MKLRIHTIASLIIMLCMMEHVYAQASSIKDSVHIFSTDIKKNGSTLTIAFDIDLSDLDQKSSSTTTLRPILCNLGDSIILPEIKVNGHNKHIIYKRNEQEEINLYAEICRLNNTEQHFNYITKIPFQKWMKKATFVLDIAFCNCEGETNKNSRLFVSEVSKWNVTAGDTLTWLPECSYILQHVNTEKSLTLEGKAYLDFPVNKTDILPNFRRNPNELSKIIKSIDHVINDSNATISAIGIHGFASPEGRYLDNVRLAKARAEALSDYVCSLYKLDKKTFTVQSTPEDWDGLSVQIEKDTIIKDKAEILKIIHSDLNVESKKADLKNKYGLTWVYMLNEFCPSLRHSDYTVNYLIRKFTIQETKDIIFKRPQQLNLQEMYLLAQSLAVGSKEFNEVLNIAVMMFPQDQSANLNASSLALNKRDTATTKTYLEKADKSLPETMNNLGILAADEGKYSDAKVFFSKAAEKGFILAKNNLEKLEKELE